MSTISDTMKSISREIQSTFNELVKLLLRKGLPPVLTYNQKDNFVYNPNKGRYEKGLVNQSSEDNINKYNYTITNDSLGWTNDIIISFKVIAKNIKNYSIKFSSINKIPLSEPGYRSIAKSKVPFTEEELDIVFPQSNKNLAIRTVPSLNAKKSLYNIIANKSADYTYTSDIFYPFTVKNLEEIGQDIIDQTDPIVDGDESAKMSTAMLRVRLLNLDILLAELSMSYPAIYDAYIEMLRIINYIPRSKMQWIINLIASLSYQRWEDMDSKAQNKYLETLGEDFMNAFNSNELITILLQSDSSEIILTSSYLYPLIKMLFIVFGFSKLIPTIIDDRSSYHKKIRQEKLQKHSDKYKGASLIRGGNNSDKYNKKYSTEDSSKQDYEPIDPQIYDFIRLFGELYPTIIGLMGGTEEFPPESIQISCEDIPAGYEDLSSLPEYLWRFNDYSYCCYLDIINAKKFNNNLKSKINAKVHKLNSI